MISPKRLALEWVAQAAVATRVTRLGRGQNRVLILAYHDVDDVESEGIISPERLRSHIRVLKDDGYRICTVSQAVDALAHNQPLQEDLAVLTFDDGYVGNYEMAWPILRDEGVFATIFLTTGFLDGAPLWFDVPRRAAEEPARDLLMAELPRWKPSAGIEAALEEMKTLSAERRASLVASLLPLTDERPPAAAMTWDQARELQAAGVELGAHTLSHPILSSLAPADQRGELAGSRDRILEETGRAPRAFALPNGSIRDFAADTLEIARDIGFDSVCTMVRGSNLHRADPFRLRRIGVGADSDAVLRLRLSGLLERVRTNGEMRIAEKSENALSAGSSEF